MAKQSGAQSPRNIRALRQKTGKSKFGLSRQMPYGGAKRAKGLKKLHAAAGTGGGSKRKRRK